MCFPSHRLIVTWSKIRSKHKTIYMYVIWLLVFLNYWIVQNFTPTITIWHHKTMEIICKSFFLFFFLRHQALNHVYYLQSFATAREWKGAKSFVRVERRAAHRRNRHEGNSIFHQFPPTEFFPPPVQKKPSNCIWGTSMTSTFCSPTW